MFELLVGVLVGFACGYGVREYISRCRRAAARSRMLLKTEPFRRRQQQIDNLKLMVKLGLPLSETQSKH
jgi:hypothetical protein